MAWLQRHHPVTVHLIEVDLSHAVLETTGACMKPDVSPLTGLSLKLPDTMYRRDYKYSLFFFFNDQPHTSSIISAHLTDDAVIQEERQCSKRGKFV